MLVLKANYRRKTKQKQRLVGKGGEKLSGGDLKKENGRKIKERTKGEGL